jgi:hypothetical protein
VQAVFLKNDNRIRMSGQSMQRKVDKIKLLLVSCRDSEAKYVVR